MKNLLTILPIGELRSVKLQHTILYYLYTKKCNKHFTYIDFKTFKSAKWFKVDAR